MTDKERMEDEELKKCLQEAYRCSDDQLLKELEEAESSLDDSEFSGAEARIYQKLMKLEEEAVSSNEEEKKRHRLPGRKRFFLAAALVALFVGMLGLTSIGEKNYFFRRDMKEGYNLVLDNDQNKTEVSSLEDAYKEAEEKLDIEILKLGYIPADLILEEVITRQESAIFKFDYKGNKVYFVQGERHDTASFNIESDRKETGEIILNEWMGIEIELKENELEQGQLEYEAKFYYEKAYYYFIGVVEKEEFIKIVEKINNF